MKRLRLYQYKNYAYQENKVVADSAGTDARTAGTRAGLLLATSAGLLLATRARLLLATSAGLLLATSAGRQAGISHSR